ncbi:MAG TPA: hypothetical protein VFY60_12310 [Pyrinomonadaceae bacterium]|nr:hypothetical protein [Pyrinomonadaceae bacterium]
MKERNPSNNVKQPWASAISLMLLVFSAGCHQVNTGQEPSNILVFQGTLEKIGPEVGAVSGRFAILRLAKYRVDKVCRGKYDGTEIVVDHLIFSGTEFEGVKENDRMCVTVRISRKVPVRNDADGIRSPSDVVETFYIAEEEVKPLSDSGQCCEQDKQD